MGKGEQREQHAWHARAARRIGWESASRGCENRDGMGKGEQRVWRARRAPTFVGECTGVKPVDVVAGVKPVDVGAGVKPVDTGAGVKPVDVLPTYFLPSIPEKSLLPTEHS